MTKEEIVRECARLEQWKASYEAALDAYVEAQQAMQAAAGQMNYACLEARESIEKLERSGFVDDFWLRVRFGQSFITDSKGLDVGAMAIQYGVKDGDE